MKTNVKRTNWSFFLSCIASICVLGCEKTPRTTSPVSAVTYSHKSKVDTDVSLDVMYNFATFAGTEWQTKVPTAFANLKRYNGNEENYLLVPLRFDSKHPQYNPTRGKILSIIPTGTTIRIERLLEDQGISGAVRVEASVIRGDTNFTARVILDTYFLGENGFISGGTRSNTDWSLDPEMVEKKTK